MSSRSLPNPNGPFIRDMEQHQKRTLQLEAAVPWRPSWASWTPTITNMSYGSGGSGTFLWRQIDDEVQCRVAIKFGGSGGVTSTDPRFTLPRDALAGLAPYTLLGTGSFWLPTNSRVFPGFVLLNNTSVTTAIIYGLHPTSSGFINLAPGTPDPWTNGNITLTFSYYVP